MTTNESKQFGHPKHPELNHTDQERDQTLFAFTDRIDALLATAPDASRVRLEDGAAGQPVMPADVTSLDHRNTVNRTKVGRYSRQDGMVIYTIEYEETTPKDQVEDNHGDNRDFMSVAWRINQDGTLDDVIHYSLEQLQVVESRLSDLENTEPGNDSAGEEVEWPSHIRLAREFARRVFRTNRQK